MDERALTPPGRPLERLGGAVRRMPPEVVAAAAVVLTLVAGLVDYVTGPQLGPLTFYLVPVVLVGWGGKRWHGVACATLGAALWAVAEAVNGRPYDSSWVLLWNALTRLVVLLTIAALLHRARDAMHHGVVGTTNRACPHCGSTDTISLRVGLVCQGCKRLS